ncbi:Ig domain-containing protein [Vibrio fluvialis]|nr:Ig domain-containing protein [Vibrio fluvialis]
MACKSKKFVGKERVVEYAIACGDSVPESNEWVRWAALRNSEINVTWDTTDATDSDSVGSLRENLATFQSFSVSGDGTARRLDHKDIWKHYCKPESTGGQPVLWIRVTDPDLTFTAFCLLSTMSKPATYDDLVTFSFEASATASDFGLMVEDTPDPDAPDPVSVAAYPETLSLAIGETAGLAAVVSPTSAPQSVIYETDDPLIATVTQNGVVTAIGSGSATITVKSSVDTLITDTVAVTVA